MPDINDQHNAIVDQKLVGDYFSGEPNKVISEKKAEDGDGEGSEGRQADAEGEAQEGEHGRHDAGLRQPGRGAEDCSRPRQLSLDLRRERSRLQSRPS